MTDPKNMKAALFDLDGVLVDTEGIYTEFWSAMDRLYPTDVPGFSMVIKGSTLDTILNTYFPDKAIQDDIVARLKEFERTMPYRMFPGVPELLKRLRDRGFKIAIVTSSNLLKMKNLFVQLPELEKMVDIVITDEDVDNDVRRMAMMYQMDYDKLAGTMDEAARESVRNSLEISKALQLVFDASIEE